MKAKFSLSLFLAVVVPFSVMAQNKQPGNPEDNGLLPKGDTFYINVPPDNANNGKLESLGVTIANNGNVLVGWEDDGDALSDFEAVWMLVDSTGHVLNTDATVKSLDASLAGTTLTTKYRAFFRKDGSPTSGNAAWGPKIKANLFGDGIGMGATAYGIGIEVPEFKDIQVNPAGDEGDFPAVQLLTNDGKPVAIAAGASDAYADADGDIRIGDWEYLANGNVVIVGESRQKDDLVTLYKGAAPDTHATYRIVDQTGKEIRATGMVSATPEKAEIWHGVGVTKNGFGVRFALNGRAVVRLFDNSGAPVSTNIDLGKVTGKEIAAGGGRGDGAGFHGNGADAYVSITSGTDDQGAKQVWLTVLNANGTVRYSRAVADDIGLTAPDRVDAAIDSSGRVLAVFDDTGPTGGANRLVLGRLFDDQGKPIGSTFFVSEKETSTTATESSQRARAAWRGGLAVVIWESKNDPDSGGVSVVGARLFSTFNPGSIESVGLKRVVPDTPIINPQADALGNWEPYISVLGNSVFLLEGNTFADGTTDSQRYVVALQPADGKAMKLGEGFYDDSGKPFKGVINGSRQNGNPGRVAGDKRPGAVNFMVGGEASPHLYTEFQSDKRWTLGFDRLGDGRYATVQSYSLDLASLTQKPLSKAIDSVNGRLTSGGAPGNQITRFGGDIAALDNGNFVVSVDDRSQVRDPANITIAVIIAPDGSIVKESFVVDKTDIWANTTAYQGGFCVRVHNNLFFFDNSGAPKGSVDQATSGESFDAGRGDGTRIGSHINSPYVFLTGKVSTGNIVRVTAWDSRTQKSVAVADVSEPAFAGNFDRVNLAVDALDRIVVSWVSQPPGYEQQQVAARVLAFDAAKKAIIPLTPSFLPFVNAAKTGGIRTLQMSVAMTTKQICIAAKGEINLQNKPELGVTSPKEINFYTVISHPDPKDDPTAPVGGAVVGEVHKFSEPTGGWLYKLDGSKDIVGSKDGAGFTSLDGTWSHDNGSDAWDGSTIGGTLKSGAFGVGNAPGGVISITEGSSTYLRIQDTGDPRAYTPAFPDPGNRKIYFGHDISKEGAPTNVLDSGVTLYFRARLATGGTLDPLYPGGGKNSPIPSTGDGYLIHDGGKGSFGIKQASGGIISFSLTTVADNGVAAGLLMNNLNGKAVTAAVNSGSPGTTNILQFDPTQWHEFWITVQADDTGKGTHKVNVYLDGGATPNSFFVTAGDGSDFTGISYIAMGAGSTGQGGALDVDYFDYKVGATAPAGATGGRPSIALPKLIGTTLTLTWIGGGKLQEASDITGPWTDVSGGIAGTLAVQTTGARKFYRVVGP